jgi:hypothetical protein
MFDGRSPGAAEPTRRGLQACPQPFERTLHRHLDRVLFHVQELPDLLRCKVRPVAKGQQLPVAHIEVPQLAPEREPTDGFFHIHRIGGFGQLREDELPRLQRVVDVAQLALFAPAALRELEIER